MKEVLDQLSKDTYFTGGWGANEQEIKDFEQQYGVIPADYKVFLLRFNGGGWDFGVRFYNLNPKSEYFLGQRQVIDGWWEIAELGGRKIEIHTDSKHVRERNETTIYNEWSDLGKFILQEIASYTKHENEEGRK
jgi:hypothetical protein